LLEALPVLLPERVLDPEVALVAFSELQMAASLRTCGGSASIRSSPRSIRHPWSLFRSFVRSLRGQFWDLTLARTWRLRVMA
jgi:hypothetical protein